jgi:hypothetical protein
MFILTRFTDCSVRFQRAGSFLVVLVCDVIFCFICKKKYIHETHNFVRQKSVKEHKNPTPLSQWANEIIISSVRSNFQICFDASDILNVTEYNLKVIFSVITYSSVV